MKLHSLHCFAYSNHVKRFQRSKGLPCLRLHGSSPRDRWSGNYHWTAVPSWPVFRRAVPVLRQTNRQNQSALQKVEWQQGSELGYGQKPTRYKWQNQNPYWEIRAHDLTAVFSNRGGPPPRLKKHWFINFSKNLTHFSRQSHNLIRHCTNRYLWRMFLYLIWRLRPKLPDSSIKTLKIFSAILHSSSIKNGGEIPRRSVDLGLSTSPDESDSSL